MKKLLTLAFLFPILAHAALRGYAGQANTTTGTTVAVTVSGIGGSGPQNGDIVLFCMNGGGSSGASTLTPPSGFSSITGVTQEALNSSTAIMCWYKVAGASEPSSYTATSSSSDYQTAQVRVYSGRNTSSPFTAASTTAGTALAAPTITFALTGVTAAAGDDVAVILGNNNSVYYNGQSSWVVTPPTGYSNNVFYQAAGSVSFSPPSFSFDQTNIAAGATGTIGGTESWTTTGGNGPATASVGGYVISIAKAAVVTNGVHISNGHPVKSGTSILYQ